MYKIKQDEPKGGNTGFSGAVLALTLGHEYFFIKTRCTGQHA